MSPFRDPRIGLLLLLISCGDAKSLVEKVSTPGAAETRTKPTQWTPETAQPGQSAEGQNPELRWAYIDARQRAAGPEFRYVLPRAGMLRAENRTQGFVVEASPAGVRVVRDAKELGLRLSAWGCAGAMQQLKPRSVSAAPDAERTALRAEYRSAAGEDTLVEWYQNGPMGLEQGFTVTAPPRCPESAGEKLRFEVSMAGAKSLEYKAGDSRGGPRVELVLAESSHRLIYSDLYVQDADEKQLPATLAVEGERVVLTVDPRGSRYPLVVDPLIWAEQAKLSASDKPAYGNFGSAVSISGDTAVIGAEEAELPGKLGAGAAYVFVRSGTSWSEQAKLTASDSAAEAFFGGSVSVSGNTIVIGAPSASPGGTDSAGAAYVFVRSGTSWSEQAKLAASDKAVGARFGWTVSLDGDNAVVGAFRASPGGTLSAGAAYVFVRSGTSWSEQAKLIASDKAMGAQLGTAASIHGDTAAVGAPYASPGGVFGAGGVYIFTRSGMVWSEQAKLAASNKEGSAYFGSAVSLHRDTVLVGAYGHGVEYTGAAYVFVRSGTMWSEQARLSVTTGAGTRDRFGTSVSLLGDLALVGAYGFSAGGLSSSGAAFLFERSGTSWTQHALLSPEDRSARDLLGTGVSLDGDSMVLGAPDVADGAGVMYGAAYVFRRAKSNGDACMAPSECASNACAGGTCGKDNGTTCARASECKSAFCVDGVCCNSACAGGTADCQSCSKATGAATDGTCSTHASGRVCSGADDGKCISGGACNGVSTSCNLIPAASTVVCSALGDASLCYINHRCDGTSTGRCPTTNPTAAPNTTICNTTGDEGRCVANLRCDGTSTGRCPTTNPTPAPNTTVCDSTPDVARCAANYRCDGKSAGSCPKTDPTPVRSTVVCSTIGDASKCIANYRCDGTSAGSCPTTNPTPAPNTTVCGATGDASRCIANYRCDGTSRGSCPMTNPTPAANTTVCSATGDASRCVVNYRCDGTSGGSCPSSNPTLATAGTACASADASKCSAGGTCSGTGVGCDVMPAARTVVCNSMADSSACRASYQCDGTTIGSCPSTNPAPATAGTMCRASTGECDSGATCSGSMASCPTSKAIADGTSCSVGTCQSGKCRAEADPSVLLSATPMSTTRQRPVTVRVNVRNDGKTTAEQPTVTLEYPTAPGFALKPLDAPGWTCQTKEGQGSCSRADLVGGGSTYLALEVIPPLNQASFTIKASISTTTFDTNLLNNSGQVNVNNVAPCSTECPDAAKEDGGVPADLSSGSADLARTPDLVGEQAQGGCQVTGPATAPAAGPGAGLLLAALIALRRRFRRTPMGSRARAG